MGNHQTLFCMTACKNSISVPYNQNKILLLFRLPLIHKLDRLPSLNHLQFRFYAFGSNIQDVGERVSLSNRPIVHQISRLYITTRIYRNCIIKGARIYKYIGQDISIMIYIGVCHLKEKREEKWESSPARIRIVQDSLGYSSYSRIPTSKLNFSGLASNIFLCSSFIK